MAQERIEALRQVYAELAKGNWSAGGELLAPDAVVSWQEPPVDIVCRGRDELGRRLSEFLATWGQIRVEAREFIELDENNVLVVARQYARGKRSGAETESPMFIVWTFAGEHVVRVHWNFSREKALEAVTLRAEELPAG